MALRLSSLALLSLGLLAGTGCGNSPSGPGPAPPAATVTGVAVSGAGSPVAGDTVQLTATATFSDGTTQTVTALVAWESSNQAVAGRTMQIGYTGTK